MIHTLNSMAENWWSWQLAMVWQTAVLIGIIWIVDLCIRKWAHPQLRYALWMLILIKLVIPPTWTSPVSVTSRIPGLVQKTAQIQLSSESLPEAEAATGMERMNSITTVSPASSRQVEKVSTEMPAETATEIQFSDTVPEELNTVAGGATQSAAVLPLSWKAYAMFIWLAGALILTGWLIRRLNNLRNEHLAARNDGSRQLPAWFDELLEKTAAKLNVKRLPRVILTNKVACPAVFGLLRPVLLIPAGKLRHMTARDTEHILLHELAHIKRGDLWVHAVAMTLQILYWYNPLLWLIRRPLQNLRELCCDATVAKLLKEKTPQYRETLLETARQLLAEPVDPGLGLLGLFENSNWLVTRLQWLEKNTWKNHKLRIVTIIALVAVMATFVLPMANRSKIETQPDWFQCLSLPYSVWMADIDGDDMRLLDFVSGNIVTYKNIENEGAFMQKVDATPEGDVFVSYKPELNKPMVTFLRSAGLGGEPVSDEYDCVSPIPMEIPWETVVTTQHGYKFRFRVVSANENVCSIEYWPINRKAKKAMQANYAVAGTVTDAETGQPIGGADVYDDGYNDGRYRTRTDDDGRFVLKTANEEHTVAAAAEGYETQSKLLKTAPFANNENFDFQLIPNSELKTENFKAVLPNGVTVELAGVCEYPAEGKSWWSPDGQLLEFAIQSGTRVQSVHPIGEDEQARFFKLKFHDDAANDGRFKVTIPGTSYLFWRDSKGEILAKLPKAKTQCDLNLSVAVGPWKTVAWGGTDADLNNSGYTRENMTDADVIFYPLEIRKGKVLSRIVNQLGDVADCRAVVLDQQGQLHVPVSWSNTGSEVCSCESVFDVPREKIKSIEFQARRYIPVTFKNVALRSGVDTTVEVVVGEGRLTKEQAVEPAVERDPERDILWQRYEILRRKLIETERQYESGVVGVDQVHQAKIDLFRVGSELVETPAERIDFLEHILSLYQEQIKTAELRLASGRGAASDVDDIKLLLLEVQQQIVQAEESLKQDSAVTDASRPFHSKERVQNMTFDEGLLLVDALRMISEMYKVNIIPSEAILKDPYLYVPVTNLYDVTFEEILRAVCGTAHTYAERDGLIFVYTNAEYAENTKPEMRDKIDFEITRQDFREGDSIEIVEVSGSSETLEVGQTYTVKGRYTLASEDAAALHVYATNGETRSEQGPAVQRGSGEFVRTFTFLEPGDLHLSFYPAEGGSSFGNLYFTQKQTATKESTLSSQVESANNLRTFVLACLAYAHDHDMILPPEMNVLKPYLDNETYAWAHANLVYLDKGKLSALRNVAYEVLAYDRHLLDTVFEKDHPRTNVGFVDGHVEMKVTPEQLENEFGVTLNRPVGPVDIAPADFKLHYDDKRGTYSLVVSIQNTGDVTLPQHRVRYYRGDPAEGLDETGNPHSGWHNAGPIEPGKTWNERTRAFNLPDGDYTFTVMLDYDKAVKETDESNNQKTINVKIQNGKIVESTEAKGRIPQLVSIYPPEGSEMALVSQVELTFDRPMMPDQFDVVEASLGDKAKGWSEIGPVRSVVRYEPETHTFMIPIFFRSNWNGALKFEGFKSAAGVEAEPFKKKYSTLRQLYSADIQKRFEEVKKNPQLKDVLDNIKRVSREMTSLQAVISSSHNLGTLMNDRQITIKVQGENQFCADMSRYFDKPWMIGSDGKTCWFYHKSKDEEKVKVLDISEIHQKNISVCDLFGLRENTVQEVLASNNIEYVGDEVVDGRNYHLINIWESSLRGDRAYCSINLWYIDAETHLPLQVFKESTHGSKFRSQYEFTRINEQFDDSEFKWETVTDVATQPEEPLGDGYDTRFINIIDGTATGRMSVRWGKKGPKGTSSSGLN